MAEPTVIGPAQGELIGDSADRRVELLCDRDPLHATWSRFGPGREGADLHVHRHHTDLFYVLDGELTIRLGRDGSPVTAPAGTLACMPPMVVHGFRNAADTDVRYLNLHAPGEGFADFMRAGRDGRELGYDQHPPPDDGVRPEDEAVFGHRELLADRPDQRVALLADLEEIAISEVWSEPGGPAPPLHRHHCHVESFYVLEGELALTLSDREQRVGAGTWVQVPPGTWHRFAFCGPGPVRLLTLHTPNCGFGAFLRDLHTGEGAGAGSAFDQELFS